MAHLSLCAALLTEASYRLRGAAGPLLTLLAQEQERTCLQAGRWQLLPFCPGVICLSHRRHVTTVWWRAAKQPSRQAGAGWELLLLPELCSPLTVPMKKAAGNELQDGRVVLSTCCPWGEQLLPTACHHCVPKPFSSSDNWIVFCSLPLCAYRDCTARSEFYSAGLELRRQISFLSLIREHTLGTAATPRASEVPGCLPPTELGRTESPHHIRERQMSVFLIFRAISEVKTFLAHRDKDDGNHSKITCVRESRAGEKLFGYIRRRNIFKCFGLWLGISRKGFKRIFILKVLSENTWSLIFIFLNNDISKSPLYNHKKIKTLQGMILAV